MADGQLEPNLDTEGNPVATDTRSEREVELEAKFTTQQNEATELGFATHEEYQEFLEEKANDSFKAEDAAKATPTKPQTIQKTPPVQQVEQTDYTEQFEQVNQASRTAYLETQWTQYRLDQSELPKEERDGFTKKQIFDTLQSRPSAVMIKELMVDPQYSSNLASATAGLLKMRNLATTAKEQAAATKAAQASEKETATIVPGQSVPAAEKEELSENDTLANEICENETYHYPGD